MSVSRETAVPSLNAMQMDEHWRVSRETYQRLKVFELLLTRWNRHIRLVSRQDEPQLWARHIDDALQLLPLMPLGLSHAIDLGTGAGFPGLILAIATSVPFTLVEADVRKAAFLREAIRETCATAVVHIGRIESANLPLAGLVTARALARLSHLLDFAAPFLTEQSICLFPKGENVDEELTEAALAWRMRVGRHPSRTDRSGVILRISEARRV